MVHIKIICNENSVSENKVLLGNSFLFTLVLSGYFHVTSLVVITEITVPIKHNLFTLWPVAERICQTLLYKKELKVLDLRKLVGVCNCAAYGAVECILFCAPLYSFNDTHYSI